MVNLKIIEGIQMPFMTNGKRDYKKELAWEKKNRPNRAKERASRNAARRMLGLKVGDGKHADHKDNNPRNNKRSNLRVSTAKTNLKREGRRKRYAS